MIVTNETVDYILEKTVTPVNIVVKTQMVVVCIIVQTVQQIGCTVERFEMVAGEIAEETEQTVESIVVMTEEVELKTADSFESVVERNLLKLADYTEKHPDWIVENRSVSFAILAD